MPTANQTKVLFVIPPEVHLLDICGPAHVFYEAAQYKPELELHFVGMRTEQEEKTSAGLYFSRLEPIDAFELTSSDLIFIPGLASEIIFSPLFQSEHADFFQWIKIQSAKGVKVCSICTGAYLLAQAGLLDGKSCTTHWKYLEDFKAKFPRVQLEKDRLFVKDGRVYTSAGVSSGIDLALYLLEELYGAIFAIKIAKEIVIYLRRAEDDPQLSVFLQYRNHIENRVHIIQDYLAQHIGTKQKTEELAEVVHMSPRNLTRLFKKTTGITIGDYMDKLRVERAVQLLSDGQKVEVVSRSCGLNSPNQLRSLLKKHQAALPIKLS